MTRDMRPWRKGEDAVLPDEMAEKLLKAKEAENPRPYPPPDVAPPPEEPPPKKDTPPVLKGTRPYFTRNKRG